MEKRRLLDETEKPGESVSTVARRYSLSPSEGLCGATGGRGAIGSLSICTTRNARDRSRCRNSFISRAGVICRCARLRASALPPLLLVSTTPPVCSEIRRAMLKTKA